jgi:CheY-like chemotaxis protein
MRILIVEDHADSAEALDRWLKSKGHRTRSAGSCAEALALCEAEQFDLLIVDIGLPDGDGWELLGRVRRTCATPAIALTGYGRADDVARSRAAGFDAHLTKPVEFAELAAIMPRFERPAGPPAPAGAGR